MSSRIGSIGGVRHLRKILLEISVEQLRLRRQRRDRRVGAHRADRLLACLGHGLHQQRNVFLRVAECLLAIEQGGIAARRALSGRRRQFLKLDLRA